MSFTRTFVTDNPPTPLSPSDVEQLQQLEHESPGMTGFMEQYSGCSFSRGLYRVHRVQDFATQTERVLEAFPSFREKILCFAYDWLGRQFAINLARRADHRALILRFDAGSDEVVEIPADFMQFHDVELVDHGDDAVSCEFFEGWLESGGSRPSLAECIGYKIPLFLGGLGEEENLEVVDLEVYWSINAQLLAQVRGLPVGTKIGKVTIS